VSSSASDSPHLHLRSHIINLQHRVERCRDKRNAFRELEVQHSAVSP